MRRLTVAEALALLPPGDRLDVRAETEGYTTQGRPWRRSDVVDAIREAVALYRDGGLVIEEDDGVLYVTVRTA